MLLIRELKKEKIAIQGHAAVGMEMSLNLKSMFQTVALPDAQRWLILKQQGLQGLVRFLPQFHAEVSGNSTDQAHFFQVLEVKPERLESCWKKQVLLEELGMKKGHS
jgi:hypothetical protein